ncbi:SURF1 family protein [Nocardioides sp. TF02-7]|uniref:SURF1 family protein n=1 Tax=Nocardioides sp. TF02-7 TaxID=2917724 RepID=UPI001F06B6B8|nr:SURF1 family protein [Nocardioides sp. TF02-7]UMG94175.1 SURF1 family protein [Nocardioides sp. TF02-7]
MIAWWSPRLWGAHLLALVCVGIAVGMGAWQYDAWEARRAAERVDLTTAAPVPLTDVLGPDDPFPGNDVGRPVTAEGRWLPEGTVLVSGRERDGREGSWVVTPMTVGGPEEPAVPVVRGWLPGADPADAPPPPTGAADVAGWLQPGEGTGAADDDPTDDVLPQLRIADLVQRVDQDMYGAYVVLEEPEAGLGAATLDQLPPAGAFTAWRNFAYAIEWWLFAAFAAFIWWRYVRDATSRPAADEAAEPAEPGPVGSES